MENENSIDKSSNISDNRDNNVVDEIIRMEGKPPLNDPKCEHEFREDPTDTIGDNVAWVCIKPDCGIGHWRKK